MQYVNFNAVGTGALMTFKGELVGFNPRKVTVNNLTDNIMLESNSALPAAAGVKIVANGTRSYVTSAGITFVDGGFTLGTDSVNGSSSVLNIEAWG